MRRRVMKYGGLGIICSMLIFSAVTSWSKVAKVNQMASDSVLRVLYYGGIKGNIAPCG